MKLKNTLWTAAMVSALAVAAVPAHAQSKKELVQKLLAMQQASLENTARGLTESPAKQMVQAVQPILAQAVPEEKREATAKEIDAEIKKYLDAAGPIVKASTIKQSQNAIAPLFEEKFTEDELKQLLGMLDSPVLKKYQTILPDMSKTLLEKVVADARPQVDPKLQQTQENIKKILERATGSKVGSSSSAPAAAPKGKSGK